jgi:hypothetical protein
MAEKRTIELDIKSNTQSLKSQFKEAQAEVQKLSEKYGATSQEAVKAAKAAAELKDQIGDAKALTDAFNPDAKFQAFSATLTGVAGGFSAVQGAMGLVGVQGEAVEQTMLKVQSAMAISQGLQSLGEAQDSFKQLGAVIRDTAVKLGILTVSKEADVAVSAQQTVATTGNVIATEAQAAANVTTGTSFKVMGATAKLSLNGIKGALASTGIGLLVVALGTIVAYWDEIKGAVSGVTPALQNNLDIATKNAEQSKHEADNFKYLENSLKLQGKSEKEILQLRIKKQQESLKDAKGQLEAQYKIQKASEAAATRNFTLAKQILNAIGTISNLIPLGIAKAIDGISGGVISLLKMVNNYTQKFQGLIINLLTKPIEIALKGASKVSEALGLGSINVKSIMGDITDIAKASSKGINDAIKGLKGTDLAGALQGGISSIADYGAGLIFDPKAVKEEGKKTLQELQDNVLSINSEIAGGQLQIQEINKKANEDNAKSADDAQKAKEEKLKQYNESLKAFYEAQEADRQARITDGQEKELQELANKFDNATYLADKAGQDTKAITEQYQADTIAIKEKYRLIDEQKMLEASAKALALKVKAEQEFNAQIEALQELNYQNSLSPQQKELGAIREKYFAMESMAKGNSEAEAVIAEAKGKEIDDINKKYADEEKKRKSDTLSKNLDLAKGQFNALGDLAMAFNAKSKEGQKRAFNVKKGADIASATIDTFKSAQMAYTSMVGIPVVGPALGVAAAGMAVATGLLNIKKIASQKFEGGGTATGGGGSAGGGGGGAGGGGMTGGTQAPSFNVVGNNGLNQLAQLQQQPMQAFVVSGEVSSAQSLDRNRIQNASI